MKKNKLIKFIGMSLIILFCCLINTNSYALEDVDNYSELYKQYLQLSEEEKARVQVIPEKYNVPYNLKASSNGFLNSILIPSKYNLAEHYNIKVEDQGQEGNCWTFASLETLETYLQVHGYGTFDFSENHLNYLESNLFSETEANRNVNTEGSYVEFQEYVNKILGPVSEEDYPYYDDEKHKDYTQAELSNLLNITPLAYVGEYVVFPSMNKDKQNYSEEELLEFRNQVKNHIMTNGALYSLVVAPNYFTEEYYNNHTYAAYFPNTSDSRFMQYIHTVAIIGWDDNYSKENFVGENKPEHDGAYIALNSWGKKFGDEGLYYISYDDVWVETQLKGIKEAVLDRSSFSNLKTFSIKDINLYNALKTNLDTKIVSYNDNEQTITMLSGIINEIRYLDLSNSNITDLSGIENFINLNNLVLEHNNISSIAPLTSLHELNSIILNNNKLTTIPNEIKGSALMQLSIGYNPIEDFSGLKDAKSITNLNLEGTKISDSDLINLKNLKIVSLNLSNTNVKDYSILNNLDDEKTERGDAFLQVLTINHNNDLIYESIPNVTILDLSNSNIDEDKFSRIPVTSKLEYLNISYTNIKDLSIIKTEKLKTIDISGNKELKNINTIKDLDTITYKDAGLENLSLFTDFTTRELNLASNNITSYEEIINNENLRILDLTNNKVSEFQNVENTQIFIDGNNIKPILVIPSNIVTTQNQNYTQTLKVDSNRENIFSEIATELKGFYDKGTILEITNATMDYDNNIFKIENYDKDVVIKFINGNFKGSTITYKLEKLDTSNISYIFVDRSKIRDMYVEGEKIDIHQFKVYAYYDNDSTCEITDFNVECNENIVVGPNNITIRKGQFSDTLIINGIAKSDVAELNFESKDIYDSVLKKIKEIEKERFEYPGEYENIKVLINNDDSNKSIKLLKEAIKSISYLYVTSDELTNINDIKQLEGLCGISIDSRNLEDISTFRKIKEILDSRDDLMDYEKYIGFTLKNNKKITSINDDIFRTLELRNTKIESINNLKNLKSITYTGNKILDMDEVIDNLRMININVSEDIENVSTDENGNIILPKIFKTYKNKNFEIEAYICDQLRDEKYLNALKKINIEINEVGDNLVINYDDIKDIEYNGKNQFIEINIIDKDFVYSDFAFKYRIGYKISEFSEKDNTDVPTEETSIPTKTSESEKTKVITNPKTGDDLDMYISIAFISIISLFGLVIMDKTTK